jgi:16S rRNA (guanine(966)-N(2))-methyltransferase RsmD
MRIIAGSARGIPLKVPARLTRPSTDRLREALFSILANRVPGASVLDLFAGSGALGLEALSRGAESAVMVDASRGATEVIADNLEKARLGGRGTGVKRDVFDFLRDSQRSFDLIFADPPYASKARDDLARRLVEDENLPRRLAAGGLFILEVEAERDAPLAPEWELMDERKYGSSAILFYGLREES